MDIKNYLEAIKELVDRYLDSYLPEDADIPEPLRGSMRYSLFAGGKRLRPGLVIAAIDSVGGDRTNALPAAAAIEMIHTYTLIHDDLPALDDDNLRRGKKTNHKVFGEAVAILAGDALQTLAFSLLTDSSRVDIPDSIILQASHEMALAIGSGGTVAGQVVDLQSEGKPIDGDTLEEIHAKKTGRLIRAAVRTGALMGRCYGERLNMLTQFGDEIGLAFQIVDDILDVVGTEENLGKDIGSDQERNKATYPAVFGIDESKKIASRLIHSAVQRLDTFDEKADPLRGIARFFLDRTN